jgi:predicted nucleic acid-binding protein
MTSFVLDASSALSIIFEDEFSDYAQRVAEAVNARRAVVPVIWPLEVANAILKAIRRGRLPEGDGPVLIAALTQLQVEIDSSISTTALARLAFSIGQAQRLSSYDASYLELAMRRGLPLATQDSRLAAAAVNSGVEIFRP